MTDHMDSSKIQSLSKCLFHSSPLYKFEKSFFCLLVFLFFIQTLFFSSFHPFYIWHLMQIIDVSEVHRIEGLSHICVVAQKATAYL